MNIFNVHRNITDAYEEYIRSFVNISDERIRQEVEESLLKGLILPEPLVQFNPSFEVGDCIDGLISKQVLNKNVGHCFKGWELFKHQTEAIEIGSRNESFVVTSGTGSGKSLTFLATIFNRIFNEGAESNGIKAVIVYPMNALINSQHKAFQEFADAYKDNSGADFPISFGKYTGQESEEERDRMRLKPPHILLTNYMMLELILTRAKEQRLVEAAYQNLQFLVFDELHTYRGRQGADVALLIRRIKAQCENKHIVCIGSSATMASGEGTLLSQRKEVAQVATKIFGQPLKWENVIVESLRVSFSGEDVSADELRSEIDTLHPAYEDESALKANGLARWLERNICLHFRDGRWFRAKPISFQEMVKTLAEVSELPDDLCDEKLKQLLLWADNINKKINNIRPRRSYLPYKIHQFIAQTGSVYVSLDDTGNRIITLEAKNKTVESDGKLPLFQVVFSRYSGHEFLCASIDQETLTIEPAPFNAGVDEDEESETSNGYVLIEKEGDEQIWDPVNDLDYLPDSWFNMNPRTGSRNIKSEHKHKLPQEIYISKDGSYRKSPEAGYIKAWFMTAPLAFDPTSQTTWSGAIREPNKLARLGIEGRSTATTVLSFLTIKELAKAIPDQTFQKLLCFTDVRQDASLQSGHFNDFIQIGVLRSAIWKAVSTNKTLNYANIDDAVFRVLNLRQPEFAQVVAESGTFQYNENEKALKLYLTYRLLYDLRRGWRVILPNLEQVALININYTGLREEVAKEKWNQLPGFAEMDAEDKYKILLNTLDFFRTSFAFHFSVYDQHESNKKIISSNLKAPWTLDSNEDLKLPFYLHVIKPQTRKQNIHSQSIGPQSAFGKYIKAKLKSNGVNFKGKDVVVWISDLLEMLSNSGYLRKVEGLLDQDLYQLNGTSLLWVPGDEKTPWTDDVRVRSLRKREASVNKFFLSFYKQDFRSMKPVVSAEHTGQVSNEDRKKAEEDFINGDVSVLYCSPTMELGVDISELNVVQMRNVPPNPANYAQRSGRAGRSGQAALVLTYCANNSPHDRHYLEHKNEMVAGIVSPPKLDLTQEELFRSHLNALFLSRTNLGSLNDSIADILDLYVDTDKLLMKNETTISLNLEERVLEELEGIFMKAIADVIPELEKMPGAWYTNNWVRRKLSQAPESFDKALDRWREIYRKCVEQLAVSTSILGDPRIPRTDERKRAADNNRKYADRQIELLKNESKPGKSNQLSEFYPYRYLAAEGFLPGYGFTKLPVRLFVPTDKGGEYISRPKFIALREFGPQNTVYHKGGKFRINQMLWSEMDNPLIEAKIAVKSGYILMSADSQRNTCPITNADLTDNTQKIVLSNMIEIRESRAEANQRITCEEEERTIRGYDITTAFYLQSGLNNIEEVLVKVDGEELLRMQYLPAARIVQINKKWRVSKEGDGFLIGKKTGFWKRPDQVEGENASKEEIERIRLYTENTADALYIQPTRNLNLNPFEPGIITLMYALKRAVEIQFQVESNEMGVSLMGTSEEPNILLFESAEGSLGVIAQLVKDIRNFKALINTAWEVCHFNKPDKEQQRYGAASYADLLSFHNQRYHQTIDRFIIKDALETLMNADVQIKRSSLFRDYDHQYNELLQHIDPKSSTELKFLQCLYKNKLRLPDRTQVNMAKYGCYTIPDFVYKEEIKVCVFCDGTPHDLPQVAEGDAIKRTCLEALGFEVIVWHYATPLDEFVKRYPHIFKTVKS